MKNIETNSISFIMLQKYVELGLLSISHINKSDSELIFAKPLIEYLTVQRYIYQKNLFDKLITLSKIILNPFTFICLGLLIAYKGSDLHYLYLTVGMYLSIEGFIFGTLLKNQINKQIYKSENWFDALYASGDLAIDSTKKTRQVYSNMELKHHLKYPIDWRKRFESLIEEGVLPIIEISTSN